MRGVASIKGLFPVRNIADHRKEKEERRRGKKMGFFDGMSKISNNQNGKYITPGTYIVEVCLTKYHLGEKGQNLIIEANVLAAKPSDPDYAGGNPFPGEKVAQVWKKEDYDLIKKKRSQEKLMSFLCAVFGCEPSTYSDEQWEAVYEQQFKTNAFAGVALLVHAYDRTRKDGNGVFTVVDWKRRPTDEDVQEFM